MLHGALDAALLAAMGAWHRASPSKRQPPKVNPARGTRRRCLPPRAQRACPLQLACSARSAPPRAREGEQLDGSVVPSP